MTENNHKAIAKRPEELAQLLLARLNAGDADGCAALYEADAVLSY